ncbi:DnaT-like ssDNA-binding protein [Caldimonas sp. KR1-144]|uniref:DnaT-like ssDNA-binding protein n=1 Tax=Caldimonas sp. KR1-144 TaxID=3400911 RepID=UPI003C1134B7
MALVVETGAGLPDADSYISVAEATAYHAARGNAAWAAVVDDTTREQLLRKATGFIDGTYAGQWLGYRMTDSQALDWPRGYVPRQPPSLTGSIYWPDDEVPVAVRNACAELALRAISGDLAPDLSGQVRSEKVGPIEVEYAPGARQQVKYQVVDGLLQPFLQGGGQSFVKVTRA